MSRVAAQTLGDSVSAEAGAETANRDGRAPWDLPHWLVAFCQPLSILVMVAGTLLTWFLCYRAISGSPASLFLSTLLLLILALLAVAIHEIGHLMGAKWGRMIAIRMQIGRLDFFKQRRGWRVRWHKMHLRLSGFVIAYPRPAESLRVSFVKMTIGGPAINLLASIALYSVSRMQTFGTFSFFCLALATMNLAMCMASLLPTKRDHPSDGLQLLWWLRGMPDTTPDMSFVRLMGRSMEGTTEDKLPEAEVAALESQAMPMPIVFDWLKLKASQNRTEWWVAGEIEQALDQRLATLDPKTLAPLAELIGIMRAEIAFSKAIADRDPRHINLDGILANTTWLAPHLGPRLQALRAALAGNIDACEKLLLSSQLLAEQSVEQALHLTESKLRASIIAVCRPS